MEKQRMMKAKPKPKQEEKQEPTGTLRVSVM